LLTHATPELPLLSSQSDGAAVDKGSIAMVPVSDPDFCFAR